MTDRRSGTAHATARLDVALVGAGLFESRAKAQEAIAAGLVSVDGTAATKSGLRVAAAAQLEAKAAYPWVSRGGVKLAAAFDGFGIDPHGLVCLDIGASTGGFTEVLLTRGAARVYAVDVGRDQLHARVKADSRVVDMASTDARALTPTQIPIAPKLVVCDASFISLSLVLPAVLPLAGQGGMLVALVKPQFEVGPGRTSKGIVIDVALREQARDAIATLVDDLGWTVIGLQLSPITGSDGNVEYLLGARKR